MFDLDGTLVDLAVDWTTVHDEIDATLGDVLVHPVREHSQNELFAVAAAHGRDEDLAALIAAYEREGAATATDLAGVHTLTDRTVPVGICTANAVTAAEVALERFGVLDAVDVIVGRETVHPGKPDPGPLLECLTRLDVLPGDALFVGNERGDAETAARAAVSFLHVDQLWPPD